jgi:putative oxidoreductase
MAIYLMIVSVELHDFWNMSGMPAGANLTQFFKNLGMVGGLLMIVSYGPGRWALGTGHWRGEASSPGQSPN